MENKVDRLEGVTMSSVLMLVVWQEPQRALL